MSKRNFAEAMGSAYRSVLDWEAGDAIPTTENIERMAAVLRYPMEFFFKPDIEVVPVDTVSFRSLSKMRSADRDRAIAGSEMALELSDWVSARFGLPDPELPDLTHYAQKPEQAALALRAEWGLGDRPIKSMVHLLEFKGVRVFSLAEDSRDLDACSFWRGSTPFVFLNTVKSSEASRFDAAHELAHLVLHKHAAPQGRESERMAHAFAAAFLMPRTSVQAFAPTIPTLPNLVHAKHIWNVSVAAFAHTLHDYGLISDWQYRSLAIQIQQRGFRTAEPESNPRETSRVWEKIFQSLRADGIGKTELARTLSWPLAELNALVFGLILSTVDGNPAPSREPSVPSNRDQLRLIK